MQRPRRLRFRGLIRAVVVLQRMRKCAAERAYVPGGTGFQAAAASFDAGILMQQRAQAQRNVDGVPWTRAASQPSHHRHRGP